MVKYAGKLPREARRQHYMKPDVETNSECKLWKKHRRFSVAIKKYPLFKVLFWGLRSAGPDCACGLSQYQRHDASLRELGSVHTLVACHEIATGQYIIWRTSGLRR